jgi:hypothetical protein
MSRTIIIVFTELVITVISRKPLNYTLHGMNAVIITIHHTPSSTKSSRGFSKSKFYTRLFIRPNKLKKIFILRTWKYSLYVFSRSIPAYSICSSFYIVT